MKMLLVLVMLLAACGGPSSEVAAPSAPASSSAGASAGAVPAALDWSVERLGGGQIEGGDLAGRDVVLWFWAPW